MKSLIKPTAVVFLSGLLVTFLFRISFLMFFHPVDYFVDTQTVLLAFIHGIRFDLSALCALNLIFVLLIYFKNLRQSPILLNLWALKSTALVFLLIADFFYYSFYSSRLSWDFLAVFNGLRAHILISMMAQFFVAVPILILSFFSYRYLYRTLFLNLNSEFKTLFYPVYFMITVLIFVVAYRGGFQKRVLSPQHTWLFADGSSFFASMTSNTLHNLIRQGQSLKIPPEFKNTLQSQLPTWNKEAQNPKALLENKPQNVLFIFIESLSSYSYENNKLPQLSEWVSKNSGDVHVNTNFYANGNLSKDALLSVFFGIPSYFDIHLFESKYSKNTISGIGQIAKQTKKETFFLHSAPAGTQFFDVISKAAGFENYVSLFDKHEDDESKVSSWGVHDEVLYEGAIEYIRDLNAPFIGTLFTTSTHTPFFGTPNNPDNKEDEVDYFLALEYADKSLVSFFEAASREPWFKNTLFVLTGDHSPPLSVDWNRKSSEMSRIPLIMYWQNSNLGKVKYRELGRHVDIPKTVFHILGEYPEMWTPYGQSLVSTDSEELASTVFFTNSGTVNLITDPKKVLVKSMYEFEKPKTASVIDPGRVVPTADSQEGLDEQSFDQSLLEQARRELKDYIYRLEKNTIYN